MKTQQLLDFLNSFLYMHFFEDSSKNWLQVATPKDEIKKIGYATDATAYIFDLAIQEQVDLVLVHHWLFWWLDNPLVGIHYERASKLVKNDIWLFAVHLPLDAHPVVGNNIWLTIGLINIILPAYDTKKILQEFEGKMEQILKAPNGEAIFEDDILMINKFWEYKWMSIGYGVKFKNQAFHTSQILHFAEALQLQKQFFNFAGKETFSSVGFVSWGWGAALEEAKNSGYDIFITGEMAHRQLTLAKELKQSVLLGWHRHTEKIWPKLLAHHIKKKFPKVETVFLDEVY